MKFHTDIKSAGNKVKAIFCDRSMRHGTLNMATLRLKLVNASILEN